MPSAYLSKTESFPLAAFPAPVAELDASGRVASVNAAMRALAPSADDWLGADVVERLGAAAAQSGRDDFGETFSFECDGGSRRYRLSFERSGERSVALLTDITAAMAWLAEVAPAREARDRLLRDAFIGTWRFDPDAEVYHFSVELLSSSDDSPGVPKAAMDAMVHRDDREIELVTRERITTEGGVGEMEIRLADAQGGWNHVRVLLRAGRRKPSGRYEMYGLTQAVTELATARDEARAAAHRLDLALKASNAGVFEYDYRRQTYWVSPEFAALMAGAGSEQMRAEPFAAVDEADAPELQRLLEGAAEFGRADAVDIRVRRPEGPRWVRVCFEAERNAHGQLSRGVGLAIDIDETKRQELAVIEAREAAEAATRAKSDFLASVSHEIRTPMNGIVGVLNLLRREQLSDDGRMLLEEALGCTGMLSGLINDVLDFSKIEAGKLEISPAPTQLAALAEGVVSLIRPQAEAKGLTLQISCGDDLGWAMVDPVRLRQCLFNIVGNAVKFTTEGGVSVRLATSGEGASRELRIEVEDSGIGVPEDARERMFDRFQQVDAGTTRRFGGTGLGLAISRQLARMMGGELDYWSREGEGSTFWLQIAAPPTAAPQLVEAAADEAPLAGIGILVVDDNRANRLVGVKSLEALGARAEAVESGPDAIAAVAARPFDLVLMDINMPGMDGLEATRRIRALSPACAAIPIIAMTADVMRHQQDRYLAAGMSGLVPKPFSPAQLLAEVMRLADGAALVQAPSPASTLSA